VAFIHDGRPGVDWNDVKAADHRGASTSAPVIISPPPCAQPHQLKLS